MYLDPNADAASDSDVEMQSACSHFTPLPPANQQTNQQEPPNNENKQEPLNEDMKSLNNIEQESHAMVVDEPVARPSLDLLGRVKGMYRLLDLVYEEASGGGGMVDKVIIDQQSVAAFANVLHPGSYRSSYQVDFRALDKHTIRPLGVYGSASAIVDFLENLGRIDRETASLLLAPQDETAGYSRPTLRPGLYLLDSTDTQADILHVIFWPESATWKDGSISSVARNRVTFMRYLSKLCDQLICLISDEDSANLVWKEDATQMAENDDPEESLEAYDRVFAFSVQQTNEEKETATVKPGFTIRHPSLGCVLQPPPQFPSDLPLDMLQPRVVVGETSQALLQVEFQPEEMKTVYIDEFIRGMALKDKLSAKLSPNIILSDKLDVASFKRLLDNGLTLRCGKLVEEWNKQRRLDQFKLNKDKESERNEKKENLKKTVDYLRLRMPFALVKIAIKKFPYLADCQDGLLIAVLGDRAESLKDIDFDVAYCEVESWFEAHQPMFESKRKEIDEKLTILEKDRKARYDTLKRNFRYVYQALQDCEDLSDEDMQRLVDLIVENQGKFNEVYLAITQKEKSKKWTDWIRRKVESYANAVQGTLPNSLPPLPHMDDVTFCETLEQLVEDTPEFGDPAKEIKSSMLAILEQKIKHLTKIVDDIKSSLQSQIESGVKEAYSKRDANELKTAWEHLLREVTLHLKGEPYQNGPVLTIDKVTAENTGYSYSSYNNFRWVATLSSPKKSSIRYILRQVEIKQDDTKAASEDKTHVCTPIIRRVHPSTFTLPIGVTLRYLRLIGNELCLVAVESDNFLKIYLEKMGSMDAVIAGDKSKRIHLEKIGHNILFAVDETKKLLAMLVNHAGTIQIHVYLYDPEAKTLNSRGGAIHITKWYTQTHAPSFTHFEFISGSEELLLTEENGTCRIFSLITENFRPSTLDVGGKILSAASTPDGACLFMKVEIAGVIGIRCFHWASFGSNDGIDILWPEQVPTTSSMIVSSVGHRAIPHLIFLYPEGNICYSLLVQITRKTSEFSFRSDKSDGEGSSRRETINNSLIDCHAEVWTRFPVHAAIRRETTEAAVHYPRSIHFVSTSSASSFGPYFTSMIREFELKTRKPTKSFLKQIKISASIDWDSTSHRLNISELQAGEWLVGMFCLIPIHLAITKSNRFVPLKDGVTSAEFENSLLGANVAQISEALSFGWYESIFSSYLARKPVKVVTSMGEQSVGKSFALNHFVDTSFAGSAMRCTEGVWLSVTPTRDYLVVAIDFEGVHSIERSAQEDTLLVLLNAAISNFVLFRNNFALSRDITGLFTSFQSCTNVLDPASNPSLFNATLGIIIKDVIDSDTKEIVNEFQQKFQKIVQEERGDNFITKLHKGKLDIIPWPVIESSRFYDYFGALKLRLDRQALTHKHAGAFLATLKMLMAKLKANDWGALDSNLAIQRAEQLSSLLIPALCFGTADLNTQEPLKNFDTDEILVGQDGMDIFFLDLPNNGTLSSLSLDGCLQKLRLSFKKREERFQVGEEHFFKELSAHLHYLAETRIQHVSQWLKVNTERFGEKGEITGLFRTFDAHAKELRANVILCGSKCSSCGLLCLEHKQHVGKHNCQTSHRCAHLCGFIDQHEVSEIPECDIPAGHEGRHVCSGTPHVCGVPCHLDTKDGCLRTCSKPMGHDDEEEHLCAAKVHACGEPCSLIKSDGTRICTRSCVIDCRRDHSQHSCDRSFSCPIKCQLCNSLCQVQDHFHALEENAMHLCGQRHNCQHLCQRPGICEILTTPQSIESTFVGKHATYQYTKYTQEARRLPCDVPIEPNQLRHAGPHVHSQDPKAFHYCEERCKHCEYYCTLPLGHPQNEHETSHGSMSQTEWVVEGDDDAILELEGRKYATGDSGAPMLCSMVCKSLGRHVHIDTCRADDAANCNGAGVQHINGQKGTGKHDWITHRLFWARSGFRDPYTNQEQAEFDLCDHRCGGDEHDKDTNPNAIPSYCTLPLFHEAPDAANAPPLGHVSQDGHAYNCKSPAEMQRSFHIFFALDRSGSMTNYDRRPLPNSPATTRIVQRANNRFGAVVSSIYGFWTARETAVRAGAKNGMRRDAYSIITFESSASVTISNNTASDPDQLLNLILNNANAYGGTNFTHALETIQSEMEKTWATERSPVVIFLSDGECQVSDSTVYDLCRAAVRLGKPLAFHAVSFGPESSSHYLRRMAAIANEVYASAPRDPLAPAGVNPCGYTAALDTVQLANTFMSIAESLKNPRAALSRI
ncbi:hypothetical protein CPB86DRAFT_144289 [Serendipita vermifera]|nr:hypothetical protein CPB86DRAFT_144289 [Serendipita vermifera]